MKKVINLESGHSVTFECNAATPLLCKRIFNIDILRHFEDANSKTTALNLEVLEQMAYVMAMQAEKPLSETSKMGSDGFLEWLAQFDFKETIDTIAPEIMDMWVGTGTPTIDSKNHPGPQ